MTYRPFITLIFPAYNEAKRIIQTVNEAVAYFEERNYTYEIIVSADGNDGTREIVAEMAKETPNLKVIGNAERSGKGYGIRKAVELAQGRIIGFSDADNKTPIEEFDKIYPLLETYEAVIGSRGLRQSRIEHAQPFYRRLGSRGFAIFMQTVVGLPGIKDTQCGFKFFQHHVAKNIFSLQQIDGYMFDVEILYLIQRLGYSIIETPIRWRDDGDSRLVLFSGNVRNMLDIFRIRFSTSRRPIDVVLLKPEDTKELVESTRG
jgi:dolichyl-phosphate beta-glucosyltransferase